DGTGALHSPEHAARRAELAARLGMVERP
ncbi:MAG: hypothetical protein RJA49_238, partial [Actinomycetota bacterium]